MRELLRGLSTVGSVGKRIRHHGDLHLGQALWADGDWLIIDFEGEPARPLPERRLQGLAAPRRRRDAALLHLRRERHRRRAREVEQDGARSASSTRTSRRRGRAACCRRARRPLRLLAIFELEKAVYELGYELAHRPDWVWIPVAGIQRLLEEGMP